ncbi:MAG: hypothetical protein Q8Q09_09685 [Deltaproteobacteria bacterium]|nr:hypothetical protein [Deltaproteobacteria bacterium]
METKVVSPIVHACPSAAPERDVVRDAFEHTLAEANALAEDQVVRATTDIGDAVVSSLTVISAVRALVAAKRAELPLFDLATFDSFERYANALTFAQARFLRIRNTMSKSAEVEALVSEGQRVLGIAISDLTGYVGRGLVKDTTVESLKNANASPTSLGIALTSVADLFSELRASLGDRIIMSEDEQKQVSALALRLRTALVENAAVTAESSIALAVRDRMFTLFRREYLAIRRVVDYVRFYEGDSSQVFPSIYLRSKSRAKNDEAESEAREPAAPEKREPEKRDDGHPEVDSGLPQENPFGAR